MKTEDTNRVNMVKASVKFSDDHPAPTAGIPAWATELAAVKAKLVLIDSYNQIGMGQTGGVTTDTNLLKLTMTRMAFKCARATFGYANSINNNTLKALVNYSETKLNDIKKADVDEICQQIHDAANTNIAGATNYGLSVPTDVTDLQAAIDIYRVASENPRQAIISRSVAKKQAKKMVAEVIKEKLEGQLDPIIDTLKAANREHWEGWKLARKIINLGTTTAKVRGTVQKQSNDDPLSNVKFTIFETGTETVVKQVITDAEGKFNAAKLPAGDFDFRWELSGYMTIHELNVHISAGKEIKRKISMKKGGGSITLSGNVATGGIANVPVTNLNIINETTVKLKVWGSTLRFYAATGNMDPPGTQYLDVLPGQIIQKTVPEFALMIGFDDDLEDFLNVQNTGNTQGSWEMRFENLGE